MLTYMSLAVRLLGPTREIFKHFYRDKWYHKSQFITSLVVEMDDLYIFHFMLFSLRNLERCFCFHIILVLVFLLDIVCVTKITQIDI